MGSLAPKTPYVISQPSEPSIMGGGRGASSFQKNISTMFSSYRTFLVTPFLVPSKFNDMCTRGLSLVVQPAQLLVVHIDVLANPL